MTNSDRPDPAGIRAVEDPDGLRPASFRSLGINEIVIVDPACDRYEDFVRAAREGEFGLHFCSDGQSAVRMARRFRADVWLVSAEVPDVSGFDLVEMLAAQVMHGADAAPLSAAGKTRNRRAATPRAAIFVVADAHRLEEEQRALACGIAGYLVRPITLDVIRALRGSTALSRGEGQVKTALPAALDGQASEVGHRQRHDTDFHSGEVDLGAADRS